MDGYRDPPGPGGGSGMPVDLRETGGRFHVGHERLERTAGELARAGWPGALGLNLPEAVRTAVKKLARMARETGLIDER